MVVGAGKLKSTDGVYGLRSAHNTEVHVSNFGIAKNRLSSWQGRPARFAPAFLVQARPRSERPFFRRSRRQPGRSLSSGGGGSDRGA